jgi:hypothetical protein
MYALPNNALCPLFIDIICKVLHLIIVIIRMNCFCERYKSQGDLARLATIMCNYPLGSSFTTWTTNLEGEEVFGLAKCPTNFPFGVESDSQRLDHVNLFRLWVAIPLP